MSRDAISIKPNNHKIYQCPSEKKVALLLQLIEQNDSLSIVVASATETSSLMQQIQNKNVQIVQDKDLVQNKDLVCDVLISFDMPIKAIVYMARLSRAKEKAFLLLDKDEQQQLHSIETLLGRAIKQEVIEGFEYPVEELKEKPEKTAYKKMSKDEIKDEAKKRYTSKTQEPQKKEYKAKKDFKASDDKWAKKNKAPNKFLGKDENGKAIFSGKDGERNHRYDGTSKKQHAAPKAGGRKISIKGIKPKTQDKE